MDCKHDKKFITEAGCYLCGNLDKSMHVDTRAHCLMSHGNEGQCIKCSCGEYVPPSKWKEHSATK